LAGHLSVCGIFHGMPLNLLLIDSDAEHAQALLQVLAQEGLAWNVEKAYSLTQARGALARQRFDVVLVRHELPDGSAFDLPTSSAPMILCIAPGQEWAAAHAMQQGYADYVVIDPHGAYLRVLPWQVSAAAQRRQTALLLEQKTQLLEVSMDSISQGILHIGADGGVLSFNRRLCELLELPAELMAGKVHIQDIFRAQWDRGDFSDGYSRSFPGAPHHLGAEFQDALQNIVELPNNYWRKTRGGRYLEIKSKVLPGGGWVRTFADVTDYFQAKQSLSASEARFRSLTELSSDWYWEIDAQFRFARFDGYDVEKAGAPQVEVLGLTRWDLGALNMSEADWDAHRATLAAHQSFRNLELNRLDSVGQSYWVSISGIPTFDAAGVFCGYRGVGQNISERKNSEKETLSLAFYDPLTALPNRRLMLDRLAKALISAARHQTRGALLFIDLDNFKTLNDTRGHDTGDALLRQVAQRLADCVRAIDTVSRLGGDEFIVMLEGLSAVPAAATLHARTVGEKILAAFHAPFRVAGQLHQSSPSIGVTLFGAQALSVEELLKQADLAMYQSKAAGRNTLSFFDPKMQLAVTDRAQVEADLRLALMRDELLLHFQPVVDQHGRLLGAEALVRWQHPRRGLVMPGDFIEVAEQTGLILPLGMRVLHLACARLAAWAREPATAHLHLAVNVSAFQLRQGDFVSQVLSVLAQSGAPAQRLKLELTESMLLNDVEDIIEKMNALRVYGVGFSLDDFGTGYSSLAYLNRLPLEQLKIDRSFVCNVLTDANAAAIARTIVNLAHSLELGVVAEGVETSGQHAFLQAQGCGAFQGYLFGRPAAEPALLALL
jgi:diguanylate cyclase (GGDEF)-like protein/PAS domain S-box-containing protein